MTNDFITSFDFHANFWLANPRARLVKEINELYEKDKSKEKLTSSNVMWGITMLVHPKCPVTSQLDYNERLRMVNEEFLDKIKIDPEVTHKAVIEAFEKGCMTRLQRIAKEWGDKLDERFALLRTLKYDLTNADDLDQMMGRTDKLWKQYITCLKDLEMETAQSQVEGGAVESLLESGKI
jgi:hypothetical protein